MSVGMKIAFLHPIVYDDLIDKVHIDPIKLTELFTSHGLDFKGETFEITKGEWPVVDDFDAIVISGSPNSAYEALDWIAELELLVQDAYAKDKKLIGVCFGHQIIAKALGGKVQNADEGWLLGVHDIEVTQRKAWMEPFQEQAKLYFINHDQVTDLPVDAEVLAGNASCPRGMFSIGNQVFCLQAHPEQDKAFMEVVVDELTGTLDDGLIGEARASLQHQPDQSLLFTWMINFINLKTVTT